MEKRLVLQQTKGTRSAYATNDPEALLLAVERKKDAIEKILPDLRGLHATQKNKPKIRFFDGLKQLQEIYRLSLNSKEIYAMGSIERLYELMPQFLDHWLREVKKRGIVVHDIVPYPSHREALPRMKLALKGLYGAKVLPEKYGEAPTDLLLWNDNAGLITLEEPYFGTILTNASLTRTFKIILELLGERL
jgi:hypothetical protein